MRTPIALAIPDPQKPGQYYTLPARGVDNDDGTSSLDLSQGSGGGGGGAGGGLPQQSVTPHASVIVPASTSQVIPSGARGWTITILTGTATFNGAAALPAGFSDSDPYTTKADITLATDANSTAYVRWNTA